MLNFSSFLSILFLLIKNGTSSSLAPFVASPNRAFIQFLDVVLTTTTVDGRERTGTVTPRVRESKHACRCLCKLKLTYLSLKRLNLVLCNHVFYGLNLCGKVSIRCRISHGTVIIALHNLLSHLTTAILLCRSKVCLSNSQTADVSSQLIITILNDAKRVMEGLIGGGYTLSGASIYGTKYVSLICHAVLIIESTLNLVGSGKIFITDSVGKVVVSPSETTVHSTLLAKTAGLLAETPILLTETTLRRAEAALRLESTGLLGPETALLAHSGIHAVTTADSIIAQRAKESNPL